MGRRIERHFAKARLPTGKTLSNFDFATVPVRSKARVMALAAGDAWLDKAANLLLLGPPAAAKLGRNQRRLDHMRGSECVGEGPFTFKESTKPSQLQGFTQRNILFAL
jgi:hypothetical protein